MLVPKLRTTNQGRPQKQSRGATKPTQSSSYFEATHHAQPHQATARPLSFYRIILPAFKIFTTLLMLEKYAQAEVTGPHTNGVGVTQSNPFIASLSCCPYPYGNCQPFFMSAENVSPGVTVQFKNETPEQNLKVMPFTPVVQLPINAIGFSPTLKRWSQTGSAHERKMKRAQLMKQVEVLQDIIFHKLSQKFPAALIQQCLDDGYRFELVHMSEFGLPTHSKTVGASTLIRKKNIKIIFQNDALPLELQQTLENEVHHMIVGQKQVTSKKNKYKLSKFIRIYDLFSFFRPEW